MARYGSLSALALAAVLALAHLDTARAQVGSWAPGGAGAWGSQGASAWGVQGAGSWPGQGAGSWGQAMSPFGGGGRGLFASMASPWAAGGSLWGRDWQADQPPQQEPILTCSSKYTPINLKVVIQPSRDNFASGWGAGWGGQAATSRLSALVEIHPGEYSGRYKIVVTENSHVEEGCHAEKLNNILPVSNRLLTPSLEPWGGSSSRSSTGVLREVTVHSGSSSNIQIDSLPYDRLDYLAGRGVALCERVVTDRWGREKCQEETPIPACCKLGYDLPH